MTTEYANQVFKDAGYTSTKVRPNDTVIVYSDGVYDNLGQAEILNIIGDAYNAWAHERRSPGDVAAQIVKAALRSSTKPDDTTCVVAYICE